MFLLLYCRIASYSVKDFVNRGEPFSTEDKKIISDLLKNKVKLKGT